VRRNFIPLFVLFASLVGLGAAYWAFEATVMPRLNRTHDVLTSRSDLRLTMTVRHDTGPISEEDYVMSDVDGLSKSRYRALGRSGVQITIDERPRETIEDGPNVAYFFQEAVQDGVWDLESRPPRGDRSTHYTIDVYQLTGVQHGEHRFEFTDPSYWATTGGHQFHLILDKNKPLPDLLKMSSTTLIEPRYAKLVADFRSFGPQSFRDKIAAAQSRLKAHG
jgi:hypothetical protein